MDWMSYLIVFLVLFGLIATILTVVRFLLGKRLKKTEKKRQMEEESRQIAESNSGVRDLVPD